MAPTGWQIAHHLALGGAVERRSTPAGPWRSSVEYPQIADRDWLTYSDVEFPTYRLVQP